MAVNRPLELRLEENVGPDPPRRGRTPRLEPEDQLTVGAEPPVLVDRNHLVGQHLGEPERLQQPHDLVVEVGSAREAAAPPDRSQRLRRRTPAAGRLRNSYRSP